MTVEMFMSYAHVLRLYFACSYAGMYVGMDLRIDGCRPTYVCYNEDGSGHAGRRVEWLDGLLVFMHE
jgi:hypothetical protein